MLSFAFISTWMTALAGLGFLGQFKILLEIPIIFLRMAGYSMFRVRNDRNIIKGMVKILNQETYSSSSLYEYGKERPSGMFICWQYFGYYIDTGSDSDIEILLFTTKVNFSRLLKNSTKTCESIVLDTSAPSNPRKESPITIWNRYGSYTHIYYSDLKMDLSTIYPMGDQGYIMQDIIEKYNKTNRLVAFIYGVTGTGKSTLGLLIEKELRGSYCHDFIPTDPGDSFKILLRDTAKEDVTGPMVIVLEEIDETIQRIHDGNVQRHKNALTYVHNKMSFNSFMDDMIFHRNIIILMTSNKKKEEIDLLDPSYLRQGRVNAYYTMNQPLVT